MSRPRPLVQRVIEPIERAALWLSPQWAERRAQSRLRALAMSRAYEAAEPTRLRKQARNYGSGNAAVDASAVQVRSQARHHDRNHDIVVGALDTLVQNIVGPKGIAVEPQPRNTIGDVDPQLAEKISTLWANWARRPEVTWSHSWDAAQRIAALSWLRDGEIFVQDLIGPVIALDHGTTVPYSIELLEADLVPLDYDSAGQNILQGIQRNNWNRVVGYYVYMQHPGEPGVLMPNLKRVDATQMRHLKLVRRLGQLRGVSILSSVMTRLDDLKDYEESERVAAKIAASMAAVIIKGEPAMWTENAARAPRQMHFQPGMVFDDLVAGERVETIDTNRPNTNLEAYRSGQLRAAAAGLRLTYSSLARTYDGTYSAQRQELVEGWGAYGVLAAEFISQFVKPTYESFVRAAVMSGQLRLPAGVTLEMAQDAWFAAPQMPWIDPLREANAFEVMERNCYMSGPEIIRRRGANPRDVLDQEAKWIEEKREWGIPDRADAASPAPQDLPVPDDDTKDDAAPPRAAVRNPMGDSMRPKVLNRIRASAMPTPGHPAAPGLAKLEVRAIGASEAELLIYGPIGESWLEETVEARRVAEQLQTLNASTIRVRINSIGGSVSDGIAIANALRRHPARKIVTVDGIAGSIASLIAMAGDEVEMPANSLLMIHAPWSYAAGNAVQLREAADVLDKYALTMVADYARKSGKSEDFILELLSDGKDHYYTAEEALALGFADRVIDPSREAQDDAAAASALLSYTAALARAPAPVASLLKTRITAAARPDVLRLIPAAARAAIRHTSGDPEMNDPVTNAAATPATNLNQAAPAGHPVNDEPAVLAKLKERNARITEMVGQFPGHDDIKALGDAYLADVSRSVDDFYAAALKTLGSRATPLGGSIGSATAGRDERDLRIEAQSSALLARYNIVKGEARTAALSGNPFANSRISELAELSLKRAGVNTASMSRSEIAVKALQSPGDFPVLLENTLNKTVLFGYQSAPFTWNRFCRVGTLNDYRPHGRYQFGSIGNLQPPAGPHAEYNNRSLSDGRRETITGQRRGSILSVSPELIVNDDLGAILDAATALGIAAGRTIEDAVYALLAIGGGVGPNMSDGNPLFHSTHGNIAGTAAAPSVASFDAARQLMLAQRVAGEGADFIDAAPAIFVGPLSVGGAARVVNNSTYDPDANNKLQRFNIAANMLRDIVDTPRLSGTRWYMFADPATHPVIEVAFVEGRQSPTVTEETNFRSSAREWKIEHAWGVGAVSWLGCVTNAGA